VQQNVIFGLFLHFFAQFLLLNFRQKSLKNAVLLHFFASLLQFFRKSAAENEI
jgi:hypothetical protein